MYALLASLDRPAEDVVVVVVHVPRVADVRRDRVGLEPAMGWGWVRQAMRIIPRHTHFIVSVKKRTAAVFSASMRMDMQPMGHDGATDL